MSTRLGQDGRAARVAAQLRAQRDKVRVAETHRVIRVTPARAAWGPPVDLTNGAALWAASAPFSETTTKTIQAVVSGSAGLLLLFSPLAVAYQASLVTDAPRIIQSQHVPGRDVANQDEPANNMFGP